MLVLSRRRDESFELLLDEAADPAMTLGELFAEGGITITLVETNNHLVKIGVQAPPQLNIARTELLESESVSPSKGGA